MRHRLFVISTCTQLENDSSKLFLMVGGGSNSAIPIDQILPTHMHTRRNKRTLIPNSQCISCRPVWWSRETPIVHSKEKRKFSDCVLWSTSLDPKFEISFPNVEARRLKHSVSKQATGECQSDAIPPQEKYFNISTPGFPHGQMPVCKNPTSLSRGSLQKLSSPPKRSSSQAKLAATSVGGVQGKVAKGSLV